MTDFLPRAVTFHEWANGYFDWVLQGRQAIQMMVAYDLMSPGQRYRAVYTRLKRLGLIHPFQASLYHVTTKLHEREVLTVVAEVLDENDRLMVFSRRGIWTYGPWPSESVEMLAA